MNRDKRDDEFIVKTQHTFGVGGTANVSTEEENRALKG